LNELEELTKNNWVISRMNKKSREFSENYIPLQYVFSLENK